MTRSGYRNLIVLSALLLLPLAAVAQDAEPDMSHDNTMSRQPPKARRELPASGHPDLTGFVEWVGRQFVRIVPQSDV